MKKSSLKNLAISAMLLALGLVLPFLTGQIKEIGNMLLPMHIPVMLCGLICGKYYGLAVGFIMPLLRSVLFGRPQMFPNAVAMAFELATYGFAIGLIYFLLCKKGRMGVGAVYISLVISMLSGRVVWGIVQCIILGFGKNTFTISAFFASAFLNAIPGIIVQLVLIPAVMAALMRAKFITKKQ